MCDTGSGPRATDARMPTPPRHAAARRTSRTDADHRETLPHTIRFRASVVTSLTRTHNTLDFRAVRALTA